MATYSTLLAPCQSASSRYLCAHQRSYRLPCPVLSVCEKWGEAKHILHKSLWYTVEELASRADFPVKGGPGKAESASGRMADGIFQGRGNFLPWYIIYSICSSYITTTGKKNNPIHQMTSTNLQDFPFSLRQRAPNSSSRHALLWA